MRGSSAMAAMSIVTGATLLYGCSANSPVPTGSVSIPNAGKAAFSDSKAIEKIYHAGYTDISLTTRDPDGVWRGRAVKRSSGASVVVSVTQDGPVVAR